MTITKISWQNILNKKMNSFLCILLMMLGIAIISLLLLLSKQLQEKFTKNISGIDMVVGAKGSPLQLILSSVYQIDSPTGNVFLKDVQEIAQNPMVKEMIPLSLGDNYKGFRIVGTNKKYTEHFKAEIAEGKTFKNAMECVLGSQTASNLGLKVGDKFSGSHGLDAEGEKHEHEDYVVVGILKFNNSVVDNLILTDLKSVWEIHEHSSIVSSSKFYVPSGSEVDEEHEHSEPHASTSLSDHDSESHDHETEHSESKNPESHDHEEHSESKNPESPESKNPESSESKEITAALIKFRSKMGMMTMPRAINQNTKLQAAVPAIEVNRMLELMGIGVDGLRILALFIMIISGVSVFVSLYNSLKERKYEMALMLSMGATRTRLFLLLLLEGVILSIIGFFLGILLSRIGLLMISGQLGKKFHFDVSQISLQQEEIYLFIVALMVGVLAAALPSLGIYKLNISRTLADE
jgi:putative ABC transport system permease protein